MSLPMDRGHISTEQRNERSQAIDSLGTVECVSLFAEDHHAVITAVQHAAPSLAAFIDALASRMGHGGRLIYLGAGTSGRLGVLDAAECPPTFQSSPQQVIGVIAGGDEALRRSSEGREDELDGACNALDRLQLNDRDTVLGIAAGGTTAYVLGGLAHAASQHAMTGLLTCANVSLPADSIDHHIVLNTGPELLTGSTRLKAGTATKLALNIITTTTFIKLGKVYSNLMVDLRATNSKLRDRAIRILLELCPDLSRDAASKQLEAAGGELKLAIIMARLNLDQHQAQRALDQHEGRLRAVLGDGS